MLPNEPINLADASAKLTIQPKNEKCATYKTSKDSYYSAAPTSPAATRHPDLTPSVACGDISPSPGGRGGIRA